MPTSNAEKEFVRYVVELMQVLGPVSAGAMFGGHGIYSDGPVFALIIRSTLYLKTDAQTVRDFEAKGLEPFSYTKDGKVMKMSYFEAPEEALEDTADK